MNQDGRGAYVLQGYILGESPWGAAYNLGIYNCRPPSVHGEERAGDTGFPIINGKAHAQGFELARWLLKERDNFGIQVIIWNKFIWSRPKPYWHPYDGPDPHISHVHWELNWWGYWNLTNAIINQHLPNIPPFPPIPPLEEDMASGFKYDNQLDFITNEDGKLVQHFYSEQGGWATIVMAEGVSKTAEPAVVREYLGVKGRLDVGIEGGNGGLVHCWYEPGDTAWNKELLP